MPCHWGPPGRSMKRRNSGFSTTAFFKNYNQLNAQKTIGIQQGSGLVADRFQARMNPPVSKDAIRRDLEEEKADGVDLRWAISRS